MNESWVGRRVRWARRRAGMTQEDLAQKVGMPQSSIARIERGTVVPRTATLMKLLAATGHRLSVEPVVTPALDPEAIRRRLAMTVSQRTRQSIGRAARDPSTNPVRFLRRLRRFGVPFVLIGELAEVAHGSPAKVGKVVEVCHASTDVARDRLAQALADIGSQAGARRLSLVTQTAAGDDYDALARTATSLPIERGILVRVAALEDLIRIRQARGTPADREAAAVLQAIDEAGCHAK